MLCLQVVLARHGQEGVTPQDLLAAAHTAVCWQIGICPKPRVDINDVLLQLLLRLNQQDQQEQYHHQQRQQLGPRSPRGLVARVRCVSLVKGLCLNCFGDDMMWPWDVG